MTARVGCVFRPDNPPETVAAAARAADESGVDELWLWEDCFLQGGLTSAAIALASSTRVVIGIGVLPVPLRNVAITAMEIATLERAFPGRLRIGIGHGVQDWMGQVGARVASPLTLLREYATALSALLRGESVTVAGRYVTLSDVQLDFPPVAAADLLFAATGPKTLALSGELAAGTILTSSTTAAGIRDAVSHIERGAGAPTPHQVVAYLACAVDDDALSRFRDDTDPADFDGLVVHGSPGQIADGARQRIDAGADTVIFEPPSGPGAIAFIRYIGAQVLPLLG